MGCRSCLVLTAGAGVSLFLFLAYSPVFIDVNPQAYTVVLPESFEKGLAFNERLSAGEKLFENQIVGPESLAWHQGSIYSGLHTGEIVKIEGAKITTVARIGKVGESRPLGLRFDSKGLLYVVDALVGLLTVDVKTGKTTTLLPFGKEIKGTKVMFLDDTDMDKDGVLYISDASTRWTINNFPHSLLEHDNSGRVITYDTKTGKISVLIENLHFPNGIQVTHDGKALLIAEFFKLRILKYHLQGPKKGQYEIFATLPGEPDNIRPSTKGGYWVAMVNGRNTTTKTRIDHLSPYPLVRKVLVRLMHAVGSSLEYATTFWPNPELKDIALNIKNGGIFFGMMKSQGSLVLELNDKGEIVQSLHSSDANWCFISEVLEQNGYLYLGSFMQPYLGKVKL